MPLVQKHPAKYPKQRREWAHHADVLLCPGDHLMLTANGRVLAQEICPQGQLLHIHYEIAVEPEGLKGGRLWAVVSRLWALRDKLEGRWKEEVFPMEGDEPS